MVPPIVTAVRRFVDEEVRPLYDEANELVGIFTTGVRTLRGPKT